MKLVFSLLTVAVAATFVSSITNICESGSKGKIFPFGEGGHGDVLIPCKYWALKNQKCGNYMITLSPGNKWLRGKYYLDTLWMHVKEISSEKFWQGRTTNRIIYKIYYRKKNATEMFSEKYSTMSTSELFNSGWNYTFNGSWFGDKNDSFKIFFKHWEPKNDNFTHSKFRFECYKDMGTMHPYPEQFCGDGSNKNIFKARTKSPTFDLHPKFTDQVIYFDVLNNTQVDQTDNRCKVAVDIMSNCGNVDQKMLAIKNCHQILSSSRHTECVSYYSCAPMDVFNACIKWGCTGEGFSRNETTLCKEVGDSIDLCPKFSSNGNLSDRIVDARCHKDYFPLFNKNVTIRLD